MPRLAPPTRGCGTRARVASYDVTSPIAPPDLGLATEPSADPLSPPAPAVSPGGDSAAPESAAPGSVNEHCVSCGFATDAPYCPRCGERRAADRGYSMRHFASEAFETLTNVDSTAWRTLFTLLLRPGELTASYMRGIRMPYMRPLQLFLIVNVIYFVWVAFAGERVFSTPLSGHLENSNYGQTALALEARPGVVAQHELRPRPPA